MKCSNCGYEYLKKLSSGPLLEEIGSWIIEDYVCSKCDFSISIAKDPDEA